MKGENSVTTILIRAIILYIVMITAMRCMGKRQLGQFQPFELAMTLMIADILATPMSDVSTPLLHGILPVAIMISVHSLITLICLKSDGARAVISGKPSVLIRRGVIVKDELERLCLSLSDLLEGIRKSGILDPTEVECAIIEADGTITAFSKSQKRSANLEELNIPSDYEGAPLALIMDGKIQRHNLDSSGLSENKLRSALEKLHLNISGVYFASLSTKGVMTVQASGGEVIRLILMKPKEVQW